MRTPTEFHRDHLDRALPATLLDRTVLEDTVERADGRACRDADPELFFPPDGIRFPQEALLAERRRVARLCRDCPVRAQCLAAALLREERFGSWGGLCQPDYQIILRMWRDRPVTGPVVDGHADDPASAHGVLNSDGAPGGTDYRGAA